MTSAKHPVIIPLNVPLNLNHEGDGGIIKGTSSEMFCLQTFWKRLYLMFLLTLHELLIAKFRLKLKKVGKTTRPFRYDLNQIPYDYTVEVTNRFKELDLIDRVPDELWTEVRDIYRRQVSRPFPRKRNAKRQNGCLRKPYK